MLLLLLMMMMMMMKTQVKKNACFNQTIQNMRSLSPLFLRLL